MQPSTRRLNIIAFYPEQLKWDQNPKFTPLTFDELVNQASSCFNYQRVKAMLHEAIFLATCNATMMNKNRFKLQRGCHTFATVFATCNAYNYKQDGGRAKRAKDELWLAHSHKIAFQVAGGMLHASNLSRNVAESKGSFYFSCNSQRNNITYICSSVSRNIGSISKLRHYLSIHQLKQIHYNLIYPYLSYAVIAWGSAYKTHLQKLQN